MITTRRLDWVVLAPIVLSGWLVSAGSLAQTLTVEGKGTVQIAPEFARMSASVSHTAETAAAAQAAADRVMTRLLAGVDALPVAEDSIDAGQIRIQPRYRWNPRAEMQEFQGYEATRVLAFKLTSLDSLGEALEMLSEQGATTVDAPQYGSAQSPDARNRALAIAYARALADAETPGRSGRPHAGAPGKHQHRPTTRPCVQSNESGRAGSHVGRNGATL